MNHLLSEITPWIDNYGLYIIFFGMMVEGTTMIIIAGVLCYLGLLPLSKTIPVAILGAVAGDQLWYFMGRNYASVLLERFPSAKEKIEKILPLIKEKGDLFSFGSRFIYSGAVIFPLSLGFEKYSYKRFTLFDTLGVSVWAVVGISLGYIIGTGAESILGKIKKVEEALLLIIVIALSIYIAKIFRKKIN